MIVLALEFSSERRSVALARDGAVLAEFGQGSGHVFNLGHGISQFATPQAVDALVSAVRELSPAYHRP